MRTCIICSKQVKEVIDGVNASEKRILLRDVHLCDARLLALIAIEVGLRSYEGTVIMRCLDLDIFKGESISKLEQEKMDKFFANIMPDAERDSHLQNPNRFVDSMTRSENVFDY